MFIEHVDGAMLVAAPGRPREIRISCHTGENYRAYRISDLGHGGIAIRPEVPPRALPQTCPCCKGTGKMKGEN